MRGLSSHSITEEFYIYWLMIDWWWCKVENHIKGVFGFLQFLNLPTTWNLAEPAALAVYVIETGVFKYFYFETDHDVIIQ